MDSGPAPRRFPPGAAALVVAMAVAVYARSLTGEFLNWDDPEYVTANAELRQPFGDAVSRIFGTFLTANWNPLQRLTYLAEWKLFGANALPFRIDNLVLHAACSVLVLLVLDEWLRDRWAATLAAAAFAVHPANVESVAWIAERKTLLAAVFALASVLAWLRADPGRARGRVLALALFAAGLLAKTSIVVLPAALLLLDLARRRRAAWSWYAAFVGAALPAAWMQILAAREQGTIQPLHGGTLATHAATIVAVLPDYAAGVTAPFALVPRHPFPPVTSAADARLWIGAALLAVLAWGVARSWRGRRHLVVALPWAVAVLLVTLVVPIPIVRADRYLYLALPFLLGAGAAWISERRAAVGRAVHWLPAACVLTLAVPAALYAEVWRSSTALWTRQLERHPSDARAWYSLGTARVEAGDPDGCRAAYLQVLRFDPALRAARDGIALLDVMAGRPADAESSMAAMVAEDPAYAPAWSVLATAREMLGRADDAAATFREGLRHCPDDRDLSVNFAAFLARNPGK